jgi:hypothetical protein
MRYVINLIFLVINDLFYGGLYKMIGYLQTVYLRMIIYLLFLYVDNFNKMLAIYIKYLTSPFLIYMKMIDICDHLCDVELNL